MGSKGWSLVRQVMQDEIVSAAMNIATQASMTQQQVDFQRGAIWAAKQLLDLPVRIQRLAETEIAMSQDDRLKAPGF